VKTGRKIVLLGHEAHIISWLDVMVLYIIFGGFIPRNSLGHDENFLSVLF
jgi:hypothetical protein